jgi:hypothetical protein
MEAAKQLWKNQAFSKPLLFEEKEKAPMELAMGRYESLIRENPDRGAIFSCVLSGKASEGCNFANEQARMGVITGIDRERQD